MMGPQETTMTVATEEKGGGTLLRRMILVLAAAALMAVMMVVMAAPAFADSGKHLARGQNDSNFGFAINSQGDVQNESNPGNGKAFHTGDFRN